MKPVRVAASALLVLLNTACTTNLEVAKSGHSLDERTGFPYNLSFTRYKVVVTHRVTSCVGSEIKIATSATVTSEAVDDGDHVYVVKANSLSAPTKISGLTLTWDKGRLTGVNASAEDRSAEVVTAVAQGVAKIAVTALSTGVGTDDDLNGQCKVTTTNAVAKAKDAKTAVQKKTQAVTDATAEVDRLRAQAAVANPSARLRTRLEVAMGDLERAKQQLAIEEKGLKDWLGKITYEESYRWPQRSVELSSPADTPYKLPSTALDEWFDVPKGTDEAPDKYEARKAKIHKPIVDKASVWFRVEPVGSYGVTSQSIPDDNKPERGLRYRLPAQGRMLVCKKKDCGVDSDDAIANLPGSIHQLGEIYFAPFKSKPFTNATFEMAFDDQGRPTKAAVARKTASAETIAKLSKDLIDTAAASYNTVHKTPTEKLTDQVTFLEAQKKLADAQKALGVSPTADLEQQAKILEAQKKVYDLQKALTPPPASVDPNAEKKAAQAAYEADEALAKANLAQLVAQRALDKAKAEATQ